MRLGLKTSSGLIMIVNGQRNPGPALTEQLVKDLKLVGREAAFFKDLINLEKCKEDLQRQMIIKARLAELHPQKKFQSIDAKTFQAVSNWWCYALREMVNLPDFQENPRWIQQRLKFPVSLKEIEEALHVLLQLGLLRRDGTGVLRYHNSIQSSFDVPDLALRQFHEQVLQLAQQSLHSTHTVDREISGITLTLKKQDLPRAKELMRQLLYDLSALSTHESEDVYHLETALFPLTSKKRTDK